MSISNLAFGRSGRSLTQFEHLSARISQGLDALQLIETPRMKAMPHTIMIAEVTYATTI